LAVRYIANTREAKVARFDFPGFLMVGGGLGLLQFGMENISRPVVSVWTVAMAIVAALFLLLGFGLYARRTASPAVDLTLLRIPCFRIGTLAGGLCRTGMNGVPFLLPLMLQVGFGLSPIGSGSITFVGSIGAVLVRGLISPVLRRHGFRVVLVLSAIMGAITLAGFSLLGPHTSHWIIMLHVFVFGLMRSTQFMTSNTLAYSDMPDSHLSRATSLGGVLQQLSVSFGVSFSAVLLSLVSFHSHLLTPRRFHEAFLLMAVIPLFAIPGFMTLSPEDGAKVTGRRKAIAEMENQD
jgi:Major Facilitator Superfamily